jgi:endo-1,4-beta-mannosidase
VLIVRILAVQQYAKLKLTSELIGDISGLDGSQNYNIFSLMIYIQGLDFVITEAKKRGLYLILSMVNNWNAFGGKKQYVQWARDKGQYLGSDDDFFTSSITQGFYMNHVKVS